MSFIRAYKAIISPFVEFVEYLKRLCDPSDLKASSTRWIALFSGTTIPIYSFYLCTYCAKHRIGLPGGAVELLIGLFTLAVLGKAYSSYLGNKKDDNESPPQ